MLTEAVIGRKIKQIYKIAQIKSFRGQQGEFKNYKFRCREVQILSEKMLALKNCITRSKIKL